MSKTPDLLPNGETYLRSRRNLPIKKDDIWIFLQKDMVFENSLGANVLGWSADKKSSRCREKNNIFVFIQAAGARAYILVLSPCVIRIEGYRAEPLWCFYCSADTKILCKSELTCWEPAPSSRSRSIPSIP
jgi:hypothetical protein